MEFDKQKFVDLSRYDIIKKKIGKGGFGIVRCVKDKVSKDLFAAKECFSEIEEFDENSEDRDDILLLYREIKIMSALDHPSIVRFIGYSPEDFNGGHHLTIITEYIQNSTLSKCITDPIYNSTLKLITLYGVASGMSYLHAHNIIHRDLKPDNILMDENLHPKISDFGLSKMVETLAADMDINSNQRSGSILYIAPEVFVTDEYQKSSDVYAFSLISYQIITGRQPYKEVKPSEFINTVSKGIRPLWFDEVPLSYKKLIEDCWSQDPDDRPTFDEIMERLKTEEGFILNDVNEREFREYVDFIDSYQTTFDLSKGPTNIRSFSTCQDFKSRKNKETIEVTEVKNDNLNQTELFPKEEFEKLDNDSKQLVLESDQNALKKFILAKNLIEGKGGFTKNVNLGLTYLTKSLTNDFDEPYYYTCRVLIEGKIIKSDVEEALHVLEFVKDKESTDYTFTLGLIEKKQSNYKKALEYFQKAADKGHAESMYKYAEMLMKGQGMMKKNVNKARQYFEMAKSNGFTKNYDPEFKDENAILHIKVCFIGDSNSGKHDLVFSLIHENDDDDVDVDKKSLENKILFDYFGDCIMMNLVDTYGFEDFSRIGPMIYDKTNIFVFVFSLIDKITLKNIVDKWFDTIDDYKENASISLIGINLDKWNPDENLPNQVTQQEIKAAEKQMNVTFSYLCSYSTGENLANFKNKLVEAYVYNYYKSKQTPSNEIKRGSKKEIDLKVLFVGNNESGQFELLEYIDKGFIPRDRVINCLNKYDSFVSYHGKKVNLHLFSTPGDENNQRIRAASYENADVIVLVFSLVYKESFLSLFRTYLKEINKLAPNAALVLAGVDLDKWDKEIIDMNFVTESEVDVYAKNEKFQKTIFCSYITGENLQDFNNQIINAYLIKNGGDKACNIF